MVQKWGRVVTLSDLKEVLNAKTEEKDRLKGGKKRRDIVTGRTPTQGNVLSKQKKLQKSLAETYFLSIVDLGAFLEETLFSYREKDSDCDAVLTF